jgi:signal peptidase I
VKETKKAWIRFLIKLVVLCLVFWLVLTKLIGIAVINGNSMYPRLMDGDLVLYYRLDKEYYNSDVVTFVKDGIRYSGRIVAQGGDVVDINNSGELLINGNVQYEEIFYATTVEDGSKIEFPYTVDENCVFVLGDMRTVFQDSRTFGAVPVDELDGKIIGVFRHRQI